MSVSHARNDRLADAIARKQLTSADIAAQLEVDPRTVDRWIANWSRIPRAGFRSAISRIVDVPVGVLWPTAAKGPQVTDELLALYPSRKTLPAGHIMSLLSSAESQVDVLALAALWQWDVIPDFGPTLARKAADGLTVRVCLGDPNGESARLRGEEEGLGELMGARCQLALKYAHRHLAEWPGSLRVHDTTLYASIMRFDDDVLVNWHFYGSPAHDSPVLHFRRTDAQGVADASIQSFERVWAKAQPLAR